MSNIIPFQFNSNEVRTITDKKGEIWFVAKDIALILGYKDTDQAIRNHCKHSKSLPVDLTGQVRNVKVINESDLYRLTIKSTLPEAEKFEDWIVEDVLPSIRKTGSYSAPKSEPVKKPLATLNQAMSAIKTIAKELNWSESSKKQAFDAMFSQYGLEPKGLPHYTADDNGVVINGHSYPTKSMSQLLKENNSKYSIFAINPALEELGLIETLERKSTKNPDKIKKFKSITEKGLDFGKNVTSSSNQSETQPHWFIHKFDELFSNVSAHIEIFGGAKNA